MWARPYDPLHDIAAVHPRLTLQGATSGLLSLSRGHHLHLHIEAPGWLHATLSTWLTMPQAAEHLSPLLQAQLHFPGGVKFGTVADRGTLTLQGDVPLHPRALVLPRWQALQQGFVQGLRLLRRLRTGSFAVHPDTPTSSPPAAELAEPVQVALQEGGWSWTAQQGIALVSVSMHEQLSLVKLEMAPDGALQCHLDYPLPTVLAPVCRRAISALILEGNTRLRLVRLGYTAVAQPRVSAEVGMPLDWVDVTSLGQALDAVAVAVAVHLLWPVLPTLAIEEVARRYLQTWGAV